MPGPDVRRFLVGHRPVRSTLAQGHGSSQDCLVPRVVAGNLDGLRVAGRDGGEDQGRDRGLDPILDRAGSQSLSERQCLGPGSPRCRRLWSLAPSY